MKKYALLMLLLLYAAGAFADPGKAGMATIHIYRNKLTPGMFWRMRLIVDGQVLKLRNGHSYHIQVKPGTTVVCSKAFGHPTVNIKTEAGKEYYVKAFLKPGLFINSIDLVEVVPAFAEQQLTKIKPKNKRNVEL